MAACWASLLAAKVVMGSLLPPRLEARLATPVPKPGRIVRPEVAAGEGIERMQIPVHTDDEAVPIQQEGDVAVLRGLPLPEELPGVPVHGRDAFVEAGEDEVGEVHGRRRR
jgi:hypothetical protein